MISRVARTVRGGAARRLMAPSSTPVAMRPISVLTSRSAPVVAPMVRPAAMGNMGSLRCFSSEDSVETREFQAETRKLLDIVTHSIYTDKEVFLRELISNASDSLEKYRYKQVLGEVNTKGDAPLEIKIDVDADHKTITITDTGIGMTREELISNLGTIARSGSKQFVEKLKESSSTARDGDSIIGQFGVGFYSSFMVSDRVDVDSASACKFDQIELKC